MYKENLSRILKTQSINDKNVEYYVTKYPEFNKSYEFKPISTNVKPYQYSKAMKTADAGSSLIEIAKELDGKIIKHTNMGIDKIILWYIQFRPKTVLITLWDKYEPNHQIFDFLFKNGNIYHIKHITMTDNAAKALIYQLYADTKLYNDIESIEKKVYNDLEWKKSKVITVVVYEPIEMSAEIVRIKVSKKLGKDPGYAHINTEYYQTIEHGRIYFCQNSLRFLEEQLLEKHINGSLRRSRILIATFKNWMIHKVRQKYWDRFMFIGSAILFSYGLRNITDLDVYIDNEDNDLPKTISKNLIDDNKKLYYVEASVKYTESWKPHWNTWSTEWAKLFGAKNFRSVVFNQKYHYYYMGLKFIILNAEVQRRLVRQRPRSYCDLIKINQYLHHNIVLPPLPDKIVKYMPIENWKEELKPEDGDVEVLENSGEVKYYIPLDKDRYYSVMQWFMKTRYQDEMEVEEIKRCLEPKIVKIRIKK